VVLLDKHRNFGVLLLICHMNLRKTREEIFYKRFHGDKESYWLGFGLASRRIAWAPGGYAGGLGVVQGPRRWLSKEQEEKAKKNPLIDEPVAEDSDSASYALVEPFICTLNILHPIGDVPMWFNNGLMIHKGYNNREFLKVTGWVGGNGIWHGEGHAPYIAVIRKHGAMWCVSAKPGDVLHDANDNGVKDAVDAMIKMAIAWDFRGEDAGVFKVNGALEE
jgi:hypothetical protein